MATTYNLISSQVLNTNTLSITFSSIPQTYTDLLLKMSLSYDGGTQADSNLWFNGNNSSTINSMTSFRASTNLTYTNRVSTNGNTPLYVSTSPLFANSELYIPNYTTTSNKPYFYMVANQATATDPFLNTQACLWRGSAAITSITLSIGNYAPNSSFYLYGIKSS